MQRKSILTIILMTAMLFSQTVLADSLSDTGGGTLLGPKGYYYPSGGGSYMAPGGGYVHPSGPGTVYGKDGYHSVPVVRESPRKQITKSPPSREQLINIAWKGSNAYSKFKMGTISKIEGQSAHDYTKRVKIKEEKAKRRWVERCMNGRGKGCWSEPVVATKNNNTVENEHKQDEAIEESVNWLYNKNQGSKPADTGPIRKEKKNGVWKFSN